MCWSILSTQPFLDFLRTELVVWNLRGVRMHVFVLQQFSLKEDNTIGVGLEDDFFE